MLMRRAATLNDVPRLLEMGRAFMASIVSPVPFNEAGLEDTLVKMIDGEDYLLQVLDDGGQAVGMIGAFAAGHFLFKAPRMATELFWWVDPEYRGTKDSTALLLDYHEWAEDQDCEIITASAFADDDRLPVLLKRQGYAHYESTFVLVA